MDNSRPRLKCPFCGATGKTKEHVWPKWLHDTEGAKELLQGAHGARMPNKRPIIVQNADGIYEQDVERLPDLAQLLPEVIIKVCATCNNEWMSALENRVKRLLLPLVLDGKTISVDVDEQRLLATWASKTFMTYAVGIGSQANPFTPADYAYMREHQLPPPGVVIWVFSACSRWGQVGLQLQTWATYPEGFQPHEDTDNTALGFLAAGGLVFLLTKTPSDLFDIDKIQTIHASLVPPIPVSETTAVHELTAPSAPFLIGPCELDEGYMDAIHAWMFTPRQHFLPAPVGLTQEQLEELARLARAGVSPQTLRRLLSGKQAVNHEAANTHLKEIQATAQAFLDAGDAVGAALLFTRTGREHFYKGDFESAAMLMELAISVPAGGFKDNPEAVYRVGQAYWNLNDPRAATWYQQAIALGLDANEPRFGLVDSLTYAGEYAEALKELAAIVPRDDHEAATVLVAGHAFGFLVDELNLPKQNRFPVHAGELTRLERPALWSMLTSRDATSRLLWHHLGSADPRCDYHFTRAWFGDCPDAWLYACMALEAHGESEYVPMVLQLGISRSPGLGSAADEILDVMASFGLPVENIKKALCSARATR